MAEKKTTATKKSAPKTASKKTAAKKTASKKASAAKAPAKKAAPKKKAGANQDEFAVIETGGKQYKVSVGDVITIEKLDDELKEGGKVTFDNVLLVDNGKDTTIGTPYIEKAKVEGVLETSGRAKKVNVVKFKSKSRYLKQQGHRQSFMKVKIEAIK